MRLVTVSRGSESVELILDNHGRTFDVVDDSILLFSDTAARELESEDSMLNKGWIIIECMNA